MGFEELTEQLVETYSRVLRELEGQEQELKGEISDEYVKSMKIGLGHWVDGGRNGQLCWGILHFQR
jgi:sarcosine/dimethylglycine N-methyltransferase